MAAERLALKTIKRLLELRLHAKMSQRQVARTLGCARRTVQRYEQQAFASGLNDFTQVNLLSESELLRRLGLDDSNNSFFAPLRRDRALPDWPVLHQELSKRHVTLALLWEGTREIIRRDTNILSFASTTGVGSRSYQ